MQVRILGQSQKLSKIETRYALHWALENMLTDQQVRNLNFCISFRDILLHSPGEERTIKGCCIDYYEGREYPKSFLIQLANRYRNAKTKRLSEVSRANQLSTLFHEVRHAVQSCTGIARYIPTDSKHIIWNDRRMKMDETEEEYNNAPWEIDAIKWEKRLSRKYSLHLKERGLKFS